MRALAPGGARMTRRTVAVAVSRCSRAALAVALMLRCARPASAGRAERALAARTRRCRASAGLRSGRGFAAGALPACAPPADGVAGWRPACARADRRLAARRLRSVAGRAAARACTPSPRLWFAVALRGSALPASCRRLAALVRRARPRLVDEPLQLHGRQRRARRRDDGRSGFGAYARGRVAAAPARVAAMRFALAAATLPFLAVNLPPARMFLGDVGAVPLGFLAAALGIAGIAARASGRAWFPLLVFLPFIADATRHPGAARAARRALLGSAPRRTTTSGCTSSAPGMRGTLARLRGADGRHGADGASPALCLAPAVGLARARPRGASCTRLLFAAIDYHWRRSSSRDLRCKLLLQLARSLWRSSTTCAPRRSRGSATVLAALQPRPARAVRRATCGARWRGSCRCRRRSSSRFGLYRGLWRFASIPDLQRIVLAAVLGAVLDPAGARDAAAAGGRAAQRARALSDRADLPDGGQPLRLSRVEGAPPVQPARGAGRAGADRRRGRGGRAPDARSWRAAGSGASSGLLDDDPAKQGRAAAQHHACWDRSASCRAGRERYGVRKVIIALPSATHVVRRRVAELCAARGRRGADRARRTRT